MPRLCAATTAFCAAITASAQASSKSPAPGRLGPQPARRKPSYHLRQSARKMSKSFACAMNGWWSQVSDRRRLSAGS